MLKIKIQANDLNEYIDFCKMLDFSKCDYFVLHQPKKAYSSKNGMYRFYLDLAKLDNKTYKLSENNEIIIIKTGKKLLEQRILETKKRGRKSKDVLL